MKRIAIASALTVAITLPTFADDAHHKKADAPQGASQSAPLSEGEVRKVDRDAQKITIRHGPLQNLDMPAMTMVFQVRDPALLEQVKAGDKVKFEAAKEGSAFIVRKIQPVR